ncbi:MAG: tubulin-like doman-containing protein [Monoglobaceae bacterium]
MYKKLLVSAGGGIISGDQQAEQAYAATIAIGLGGTGISCLRTLKKEVYDNVKPDPDSGSIPTYKHIKFLAVDTDDTSLGDNGHVDTLDSKSEYVDISCKDIKGLLAHGELLTEKSYLKWLKVESTEGTGKGISIDETKNGAGGVRQIGRLLLLQNCNKFVESLKTTITNAIAGMANNPDINIHIFTGISGGTGAGTFLDVCYILKKVLSDMSLAGRASVFGYFFMPDINISNHNTGYLQANGFASMKELDYCMNYANNGGKWSQQYDGFRVETKESPVELAHLITATAFDGSVKENPYDYAMNVVVDYVMEFIVKPYIPEGANAGFTIQSHKGNIRGHIDVVSKERGACYNYCVLGAAKAYLPYKEINTYLTSKIFEGFAGLNNTVPTDADIDSFLQINNLTYDSIVRELNKAVPSIPLVEVNGKELQKDVTGKGIDQIPDLLTPMSADARKIVGVRARNKSALIGEKTNTFDETSSILALSAKVKSALSSIAADPDKGPYYAAAMINSVTGRSIIDHINGYIKQNEANLQQAQANLGDRERAWADTLNKLQNAKTGRDGKAKKYIAAVRSWLVENDKIKMYSTMNELLVAFKSQIEELRTSFFSVFTEVFTELQNTFSENLSALSDPTTQNVGYSKKMVTIQELHDSLDESVKAMNIGNLISGFVGKMMSTPDVWTTREESKISAAVIDYFAETLKEYTQRTIVGYLEIKYDTKNMEQLTDKIYNDFVLDLRNESKPLFHCDGSIYQFSSSHAIGYMSAPVGAKVIENAVDKYANDLGRKEDGVEKRLATFADRISVFRMNCGVPMFGYIGAQLYKGEYEADSRVGKHLYEGSKGDARDSRELVDITPISLYTGHYSESQQQKIDLYAEAQKLGVVAYKVINDKKDDFHINIYDFTASDEIVSHKDELVKLTDVTKLNEIVQKLKAAEPQPTETIGIRNTGYDNYIEIAVRDHVLDSREHLAVLTEQTGKVKEYRDLIAVLESKVDESAKQFTDFRNFSNALLSGVIKVSGNGYVYEYVRKTMFAEENVKISDAVKEPYGAKMPLYSAFCGYIELGDDVKESIVKDCNAKLTMEASEKKAALDAISPLLNPEVISRMLDELRRENDANIAAIESFLADLIEKFKTALNGI